MVESKLIITSDDGSGYPDIVIQSLDGVHMFYQQAGESAYYTNMEKFMPGTWKASWQDAWFIVTMDESGTSTWKRAGTVSAGTYDWSLEFKGSRIVVKFTGATWNDQLLVLGITDGKLEMKNKDGGHVDFERVTGE